MYEINKETYALIAKDDNTTQIIEKERNFCVKEPIIHILKRSCEYYGSSLDGRLEGSKHQLGMLYKLPITIEGSNEIILFPTTSLQNTNCCWIALKHIKNYKSIENNSLIIFNNDKSHLFPISKNSLENQIFRATKLLLENRRRRNL